MDKLGVKNPPSRRRRRRGEEEEEEGGWMGVRYGRRHAFLLRVSAVTAGLGLTLALLTILASLSAQFLLALVLLLSGTSGLALLSYQVWSEHTTF